MDNASLRLTPAVWDDEVDNGGMFPARLSVHVDPDGGKLPYLAVCRSSWGGGGQARRATLEEAKAHTWQLHERLYG